MKDVYVYTSQRRDNIETINQLFGFEDLNNPDSYTNLEIARIALEQLRKEYQQSVHLLEIHERHSFYFVDDEKEAEEKAKEVEAQRSKNFSSFLDRFIANREEELELLKILQKDYS